MRGVMSELVGNLKTYNNKVGTNINEIESDIRYIEIETRARKRYNKLYEDGMKTEFERMDDFKTQLCKEFKFNKDSAEALYTALITDTGSFRYNSTTTQFEGYTTGWGAIGGGGGGATGGGSDEVFVENDQVVTTSYTLGTNKNASTVSPSLNSGVVITIPANATLVIL